jgi:phospholipid/cholesterol/gamma-HCH transport system substrate-binding protein
MPRTRSLAWAELKIGILALSALALAGFLIFMVGGQAGFFWQQYRLSTRFADVQGLKAGAVVRVAGVEVGTVDSVRFEGTEVEVVLRISRGLQDKITTDSVATIGSLSLLGEPIIEVSPSATGRPLTEGERLRSRRAPGQLADVAEGAARSLEEATRLLQDVRAGKGTVGRLFSDEALYKELLGFIGSAEDVVTSLNTGRGTLGRLLNDPAAGKSLEASLRNLQEMTARINAGEGSLGQLVNDPEIARSVQAATGNLAETTARINRGEGTVGKLVTDETLFNRLNSLSERLDQLMAGLEKGEGTAGQLLQDEQLYENMNQAVAELRGLIGDVRKDPRRYLNVRVSLF